MDSQGKKRENIKFNHPEEDPNSRITKQSGGVRCAQIREGYNS